MSENLGMKPTIEQLLDELKEAKLKLEKAIEQEEKDLVEAQEIKKTAEDRVRDAYNIFNGISKKIDEALLRLHQGAPLGTAWREGCGKPTVLTQEAGGPG